MEIPGPATSGTDRNMSRQLRLGAGRKRTRLLVAHVNPLYFLILVDGVDDAVQRIANDPVDPFYPGIHQSIDYVGRDRGHDFPRFRSLDSFVPDFNVPGGSPLAAFSTLPLSSRAM